VEQFDTLLPILTVEEMLMYTAELKRPLKEPTAIKRAAVEVRGAGRAPAGGGGRMGGASTQAAACGAVARSLDGCPAPQPL
jgi:hypothetical protein